MSEELVCDKCNLALDANDLYSMQYSEPLTYENMNTITYKCICIKCDIGYD